MLIKVVKPFNKLQVGDVFDDPNGRDYVLNGLAVEVKMGATPQNKMARTPENKAEAGKAPADGEAQPSSVSQAAQASPQTTATSSRDGGKRPILRLRKKRVKQSQ